jgi:hypothetical protein
MSKIGFVCSGPHYDMEAWIIAIPEGRSINADAAMYPGWREAGKRHLEQWLKDEFGYRDPTEDEVEGYSEY